MRSHGIRIGALAAMTAITGAGAQMHQETGSRILVPAPADIPYGLSPADTARATLMAFGVCTVRTARGRVERALALPPLGAAYDRAIKATASPDCLAKGMLGFSRALLRGSLFIGLYRVDFAAKAGGLSPLPLDFAADVRGDNGEAALGYISLHQFADCVVRADPPASRALVLAAVASRAELAAFQALMPRLAACIVPDQKVAFSKITLTGLIAEALYRETRAAVPR